jgi:hypothetical protein
MSESISFYASVANRAVVCVTPAPAGFQESIPIQEVFAVLKSSPHGLTSNDGTSRLQIFGPNKLEEKKVANSLTLDPCQFLINTRSHD